MASAGRCAPGCCRSGCSGLAVALGRSAASPSTRRCRWPTGTTSTPRAGDGAPQVADLVTSGRLPDPIPVTGTESVQVVDAPGPGAQRLADGDRLTPLLTADELAGRSRTRSRCPGSRLGMSSELRVTATRAGRRRRTGRSWREPVADLARSQHTLLSHPARHLPAAAARARADRLAGDRRGAAARRVAALGGRAGLGVGPATSGCRCPSRATRSTRWP